LIVSDTSSCRAAREGDSESYLLYSGTMCLWFIVENNFTRFCGRVISVFTCVQKALCSNPGLQTAWQI